MTVRKGIVTPIVILGSLIIVFTLSALSLQTNFSQKDKNIQNSQKIEADQLPGWKTYTDKESNFTIRYPEQWSLVKYGDFAADFKSVPVKDGEASPSSVKVRYSKSGENADLREFEKIIKLSNNQKILEPLDVRSQLTKNKNFKIGSYDAIDFQIERNFSAPQGPRKEFSQIYEVKKENYVLRFSTHAPTQEELTTFNDSIFSSMISSLTFNN